ncbi:MAG: efflux RND transporter periplasmic adaptor subunit [Clostridiales bacterium]|nr:efflux RND transporter periplasmic adaptor subunit [Clostridiales bacterium]
MKKQFKRKKLILILVIIAAVIIALVFFVRKKLNTVTIESNVVELEEVQKRDLSEYISLKGTGSGESSMNYSSSAASEILTVNVAVGDEVKVGDVIATLDTEAIQSEIDMLETFIANAEALAANTSTQNQRALEQAKSDQETQLAAANQAISSAQSSYDAAVASLNAVNDQITALTDQMNASEDEAEKADLAAQISTLQTELPEYQAVVSSAEAAVSEAKANYNSVKSATDEAIYNAQNTIDMEKYSTTDDTTTQKQLDTLYSQLDDCEIISQTDGIVTDVKTAVGDVNTPDATLVTVESVDTMIMTATVDETDILSLEEGMKAIITADALPDEEINGEIVRVVKVLTTSSETGTGGFSVDIRMDDCELLSGMSVKAKIILTDKSDILCVPYDLVQYDEDGQAYVLVAEENNVDMDFIAVRRDIEVGEEMDYYVEVTGGDLAEGDYIIMDYSIVEGDIFDGSFYMEEESGEDYEEEITITVG